MITNAWLETSTGFVLEIGRCNRWTRCDGSADIGRVNETNFTTSINQTRYKKCYESSESQVMYIIMIVLEYIFSVHYESVKSFRSLLIGYQMDVCGKALETQEYYWSK